MKNMMLLQDPSSPQSGDPGTVSTSLPTSTRSMCRSVGNGSNLNLLTLALPFNSFIMPSSKLDRVHSSRLVYRHEKLLWIVTFQQPKLNVPHKSGESLTYLVSLSLNYYCCTSFGKCTSQRISFLHTFHLHSQLILQIHHPV